MLELASHHTASRIIQFCAKYGSEQQRSAIMAEVRASMVELSKGKHGHHLVQKLIAMSRRDEVSGVWATAWAGEGGVLSCGRGAGAGALAALCQGGRVSPTSNPHSSSRDVKPGGDDPRASPGHDPADIIPHALALIFRVNWGPLRSRWPSSSPTFLPCGFKLL